MSRRLRLFVLWILLIVTLTFAASWGFENAAQEDRNLCDEGVIDCLSYAEWECGWYFYNGALPSWCNYLEGRRAITLPTPVPSAPIGEVCIVNPVTGQEWCAVPIPYEPPIIPPDPWICHPLLGGCIPLPDPWPYCPGNPGGVCNNLPGGN